jgi:WD40 repeat protein
MPSRYDVFLCHNQADDPVAEELAQRLRAEGLEPWLDESDLRRGVQWTEEVEKCLVEESASCAVIIGPSGLGPWQKRELDLALDRHVEAKRAGKNFPVIPVLLPGGELKALPPFLKGHSCVFFPKTLDDKEAFGELVRAIRGLRSFRSRPTSDECPYRGLEFFDVAHAPYFYGREDLTARLVEKLRSSSQNKAPNRFLAIVGASGSGKSSLARAGLVAALKHGAIEGSDQWPIVICRPGSDPCASLAVELARLGGLDLEKQSAFRDRLKDRVQREQTALDEDVRQVLTSGDSKQRLVILVDQFEELFTICRDEKLRTAFVDNLVYASQVPQGQTLVLLAMRADFYGKCATYSNLANALSERQQLIGPMSKEELREAIEKPAQKVGCELEPGLVDLLLNDVVNDPGSLPFLQFALKELWNRRTGRKLTTESYRAIGGVTGALQRKADEVYSGLSESQQQICRRIFLRLTQPGEGTEDTKRRVPLTELQPKSGSIVDVESVLFNLSEPETRLVTGEAEDGREFVEVAHEALIRGWPTLRSWIDADRAALLTQRRLTEAANQWEIHRRDSSFLYQGGRLVTAQEWASAHPDEISRLEADFLRAAEQQARRVKFLGRAAALGLITLTILALVGVGVAEYERDQADQSAQRASIEAEKARAAQSAAEKSALQAKNKGEHANWLLYSREIADAQHEWEQGDVVAAWRHLDSSKQRLRGWEYNYLHSLLLGSRQTLRGHTDEVTSVAFSRDGNRIVSGSWDKTIKVWDATSGHETLNLKGHTGGVTSVAFSADGKRIVSGGDDKTIRVWDTTSGQQILVLKGHTKSVTSVAFSADRKRIVSGGDDKTIRVWDTTSGQQILILKGHNERVNMVAFSPDGKQIVSVSWDRYLKLWDATSGQETLSVWLYSVPVASAISPDGKRVVGGGGDNSVLTVWDVASGHGTRTLTGHTGAVYCAAFSPDGKRIVSGGDDKTIRVWDTSSGQQIFILKGHTELVKSVAFSPDGTQIVSGSPDMTIKLWDAMRSQETLTLTGHDSSVTSVAFSPDGKRIVSGSADMTIKVWETASGRETFTLTGHDNYVHSVAFSPDGKRIVSGAGSPFNNPSNTVKVWDAIRGQEMLTLKGRALRFTSVAFSPDGKRIVSASAQNTITLWDASTGEEALTLNNKNFISTVAFSPDGKRIVSDSSDHTIKLWDAKSGQETLTLKGHTGPVESVAFSSDGKWIVSGSYDTTIKLWDAASGQNTLTLKGHTGRVLSVAFSPDGKRIASGGQDKTLRLWDTTSGQETLMLQGHAGSINSVAFSADGKRIVSGSSDRTIKVWDTTSGQEINGDAALFKRKTVSKRAASRFPNPRAAYAAFNARRLRHHGPGCGMAAGV